MREIWKPVARFETLYEVSNLGRVRSLPKLQRYLLRNGKEAFRRVPGKIREFKINNSGYLLVELWSENVGFTTLVHRLVASAFVEGEGDEVNHINGVKVHNAATNLEWTDRSGNLLHAVKLGLNKQAVKVKSPITGFVYDSITQAAQNEHVAHRTASKWRHA